MNLLLELGDAFAREQPQALNRVVQGAEPADLARFLSQISPEAAAQVINQALPLTAAHAVRRIALDSAGEILSKLSPWSLSALMIRLDPETRTALLAVLPRSVAEPVRHLLDYSEAQVGSRMDPRAPCVFEGSSVKDAVLLVQSEPAGALYYTYVVAAEQVLTGVVNMRELMSADPKSTITGLMTPRPDRLHADDPIDTVAGHPAWQRVHALPVVDKNERYLGAIRYSAFRRIEVELGRSASSSDPTRTAGALAELFWLGASAVARTAETAVLGSPSNRSGSGS